MIIEMLSYDFMQRCAIVGCLVSLCAALLGVSLVLKKYSMIGDGLSHVAFGTLTVAAALGFSPLEITVPVVIIAAFMLLKISENSKLRGDSAIALISTSALSIGVIASSVGSGINTDLNSYMFGSILAASEKDVVFSTVLCTVVILLFVFFYNRIFSVTFDEAFSKATGTRPDIYNMLIAVLTAVTVVLGMRMMGTLLISGLIIFPALTAMRICKSFKGVIITSAIVSVSAFFIGMTASFALSLPTGASVVVVNIIFFTVFYVIGKIKG